MNVDDFRAILARSIGMLIIGLAALGLLMPAARAQDNQVVNGDASESEDIEEVVVTGSRIRRDTYSSISPLQVITAQVSREVGLIDAADILQKTGAASGTQIDLSFSTFVVDNGPGASTISLRGLGDARTLVLLNGRRLAPAGVEGAPAAADLNLVPSALVQQYDLLLDGASSIYGSDAVAGVANIILRKDFDGFEFETFSDVPSHGGGISHTLSAMWGKNGDRGFIGIAAEYEDNESVKLGDRPWTSGCYQPREIDENGVIRTNSLEDSSPNGIGYNMRSDGCAQGDWTGPRFFDLTTPFGSLYYTPGSSNTGIPGISETNFPTFGIFRFGLDFDDNGQSDLAFRDFSHNGREDDAMLFPESSRTSIMAFGEYTFEGESNLTPFFEANYNQRDFFYDGTEAQIFPDVPGTNPFNPCNPDGIRGVDCGLAWDAWLTNPAVVQDFRENAGAWCASVEVPDEFCEPIFLLPTYGAIGPSPVIPIVTVNGDRSGAEADVEQVRAVAGLRGDMPWMNVGVLDNWAFEAAVSRTKSDGTSSRLGIRDDRLNLSLGNYSSTGTPCENDFGVELTADAAPGCVPVDLFADSLAKPIGELATQQERAYLFDSRDFRTEYTQTLGSLFVTGDLFQLPAGPVSAVFGFEYRDDEIRSIPDEVAREGLLTSFFADGGATGDKWTREWYGEVEVPILAGKPAATELTMNLSGRRTTDEFYGSDTTYSGKIGWRPIDSLLIRGTYGTSFRAPNLRENFLIDQTGFGTVFDPCVTPPDAWDELTETYTSALDGRDPEVVQKCRDISGVQPGDIVRAVPSYSAEIATAGVTDIFAETSDSWSAGFAFEQPWFESFDLTIGGTYYSIDIRNAIIEPGPSFIVEDCYSKETENSVFCSRITRDEDGFLDLIDAGFINRDQAVVEGYDINVAFDKNATLFSRPLDLGIDVTLNRGIENSTLFRDANDEEIYDDDQGEWGLPDWQGLIAIRAEMGDFRFTWQTRYLGPVDEDSDNVDEFGDIVNGLSSTCLGPQYGDVQCRDVAFSGGYSVHAASLYYFGDVWTFGVGLRNVFDKSPPIADQEKNFISFNSVNGVVVGNGYDLNGRTIFANVQAKFGGGL